eukprot:1149498-Pelagomonas_calceolata.AAC.5
MRCIKQVIFKLFYDASSVPWGTQAVSHMYASAFVPATSQATAQAKPGQAKPECTLCPMHASAFAPATSQATAQAKPGQAKPERMLCPMHESAFSPMHIHRCIPERHNKACSKVDQHA